jgi:hypothetical protein
MCLPLVAWLKARDVAVIGSDGVNDVMPSGVEGLFNPLHELVLVGLGMPILDNLDLELLASVAAQKKRSTFFCWSSTSCSRWYWLTVKSACSILMGR